jgi:hypothetical protein
LPGDAPKFHPLIFDYAAAIASSMRFRCHAGYAAIIFAGRLFFAIFDAFRPPRRRFFIAADAIAIFFRFSPFSLIIADLMPLPIAADTIFFHYAIITAMFSLRCQALAIIFAAAPFFVAADAAARVRAARAAPLLFSPIIIIADAAIILFSFHAIIFHFLIRHYLPAP